MPRMFLFFLVATCIWTLAHVYMAKRMTATLEGKGRRRARVAWAAVASLGVSPKEITWQAGVDVLCLGGTKNGFAIGEAVVFFNRDLAQDFDYRCKQGGQLASKTRFLSAQWIGMLAGGAWLRRASQANENAQNLDAQLRTIDRKSGG